MLRLRRILVLFVFLNSVAAISAEGTTYWVLGSFSSAINADLQRLRFQALLDIEISLRPIANLGVVRLLIERTAIDKETLDSLGIGSWAITLD